MAAQQAWWWRKRGAVAAVGAGFVVVGVVVMASVAWIMAPRAPDDPLAALSDRYGASEVVDRHGEVLGRLVAMHRQQALISGLAPISPRLIAATLAAEDSRFYSHIGVDPVAIGRAAVANLRAGRVVSGASTLTQQVARMLAPSTRTWRQKLKEAAIAIDLERRFDKATLLSWYLSVAPYGGLLRGVQTASVAHFGRQADALSWLQAATLAVIPRSPERLDPRRHPQRARATAERLLRRMHSEGLISDAELASALAEKLEIAHSVSPFEARHALAGLGAGHVGHACVGAATHRQAVDRRASGDAGVAVDAVPVDAVRCLRSTTIETTLDAALQRDAQAIVRAHHDRLVGVDAANAAAVVLDAKTGAILAMVGSQGWADVAGLGANNGVIARRQPGSTLKPFIYAMHFDAGGSPADVLLDVETHFDTEEGDWRPDNYARRYHGPVRARVALASSLNVPAVRLTERVGLANVHEGLRRAGLKGLDAASEHYGLGLALGDAEVTLLDLAGAYTAIGHGGVAATPWLVAGTIGVDGVRVAATRAPSTPIFSAAAAYQAYDVLADAVARAPAFGRDGVLSTGFDVAIKTGTSKGYRDALAIAVSADVVVAVWVGNFDGRPTDQQTGARGAGPLLADLLGRVHRSIPLRRPSRPAALARVDICPQSGQLPGAHCHHLVHEWVARDARPLGSCTMHGALASAADAVAGIHLPAAARPWARRAHVKLAPDFHGRSPGFVDAVQIIAPIDGARFWRDSSRPLERQAIELLAESDPAGAAMQWVVDGEPIGPSAPAGTPVSWTPARGHHRVEAWLTANSGGRCRPPRCAFTEFDVLGVAAVAQTSAIAPL